MQIVEFGHSFVSVRNALTPAKKLKNILCIQYFKLFHSERLRVHSPWLLACHNRFQFNHMNPFNFIRNKTKMVISAAQLNRYRRHVFIFVNECSFPHFSVQLMPLNLFSPFISNLIENPFNYDAYYALM